MNNAFIAQQNIDFEDQPKNLDSLRAEETNLMAIIDSCIRLANHPDWLVLKEKVFDGVVDSIRKRREIEIEKKPLNGPTIHNLNGQLEWAKKYSDILSVASIYKQRLEQVRKVLDAERKRNASSASLDPAVYTGTDFAA